MFREILPRIIFVCPEIPKMFVTSLPDSRTLGSLDGIKCLSQHPHEFHSNPQFSLMHIEEKQEDNMKNLLNPNTNYAITVVHIKYRKGFFWEPEVVSSFISVATAFLTLQVFMYIFPNDFPVRNTSGIVVQCSHSMALLPQVTIKFMTFQLCKGSSADIKYMDLAPREIPNASVPGFNKVQYELFLQWSCCIFGLCVSAGKLC